MDALVAHRSPFESSSYSPYSPTFGTYGTSYTSNLHCGSTYGHGYDGSSYVPSTSYTYGSSPYAAYTPRPAPLPVFPLLVSPYAYSPSYPYSYSEEPGPVLPNIFSFFGHSSSPSSSPVTETFDVEPPPPSYSSVMRRERLARALRTARKQFRLVKRRLSFEA